MKIKLSKKENSFKKKDFAFNPNIYWEIAIGLAALFILLSCFFGFYLFTKINQESVLSDFSAVSQVPTVKRDRLEKVLNYFLEKENKSIEILNSGAPVVDPSK